MSIKVMISDGHADFRTLLMHHVTTHWPDAIITAYDPTTAGHLPDEFSGAGNDIILLGDDQGDREAVTTLRKFVRAPGIPPIVYFGKARKERDEVKKYGADAFFVRDDISHDALVISMSDILRSKDRIPSTGSLFIGDLRTGVHPLVKGYRYIKRLAVSEHSAVYLAEKESAGVRMVLKVMRQVPDLAEGIGAFDRFLQEYEMIAELQHPNIVRIYDLGVSDDHAHIAMEYLSGGDLRQRIRAGIAEKDAVRYLRQIAGALSRIHDLGILHRDLKPGNIMLRADDSIALIDFGLAKHMRLEQEITGSGQIFGTPYYMSPEQGHANEVDVRSDVYSLGVIFFEMLTGEKPYVGTNAMSIIIKHTQSPIPVLPPNFERYQELINRMLAKQPEDRLQKASEVPKWL